jgi:copper transport protein
MVSVAVLTLTGLVASVVHLESVAALWEQRYGRLLVLKLAGVGAVLALGFLNWRRITPRLDREDGQRAMRRAASLELLIANLVLAVTAILTRTAPLDP